MRFVDTDIPGVLIVEYAVTRDVRGSFTRTYCEREFGEHGLDFRPVQIGLSYNRARATMRGMHYQARPGAECKLVRCSKGRICDVAVDLRPDSPTYCRWVGHELSEENQRALFIPSGLAHGFLTLEPDTEVSYLIDTFYDPALGLGVRWDDPTFKVEWPVHPNVISHRDTTYPDFVP